MGAAINSAIVLILFLSAKTKWKGGVTVLVSVFLGVVFGMPFVSELAVKYIHGYKAARFVGYLNPFGSASGAGSQLVNSYYAISNGGLFGKGLGNSIQKMGYLPEPNTDFILAVIAEELGLITVILILLGLGIIVCRTIQIGARATNQYDTLICYGVATFILVEASFNIGAVCGLLPITGVTLPFISYGGSSMLVLCFASGWSLMSPGGNGPAGLPNRAKSRKGCSMQMPDEQFEFVPRRGLAVYISSRRVIRALRHYGRVHYVSKRAHYAIIYVDEAQVAETIERLEKLHNVKRVVPSALPDLDPDVADLASTGLYKTHDEDD